MFLWVWLLPLVLVPLSSGVNPGVKVRLTQKGLDYGRELGVASIQTYLKTIRIPDLSGSQRVSPIGKVDYTLSSLEIREVTLPKSGLDLVPGTGVKLSIRDAFISLSGKWKVKYLRFIKDDGTFDLKVTGLTIDSCVSVGSDDTGRPTVDSVSCDASVGDADVKFHGGASWLYNLFRNFIDKALRDAMQKQICPLVANAVSDINPQLKTLNVVAQVDQYTEIQYSLVSSPSVSSSSVDFSLKGEFFNIGKHQEAPFSPVPWLLPPQEGRMLFVGMSSYTVNTAAFSYHRAGALSLYITDDMIPQGSPFRLNTKTFGKFIPQIGEQFPGLMMKLLLQTLKPPNVTFSINNVSIEAEATVTAFAIQPNATLTPLFILNTVSSVSGRVFITDMKVCGEVALNRVDLTLRTSYVGDFQVESLDRVLQMVLKMVVLPKVNVKLAQGYPLPALGNMKLLNTQVQLLQNFLLIGTDVQFTG